MSRLPGSDDVLADPEGFWRFQGLTLIAGVDEVGRGPLAGPVVAAAEPATRPQASRPVRWSPRSSVVTR